MSQHSSGTSDDAAVAAAPTPDPAWPLFYQRPELLSSERHGEWRVRDMGVGFASQTNSVPVLASEFTAASHWYPLVFAGPANTPVALLGLEGRNVFVSDDIWRAGAYVPAYVRRYPFVFAEVTDPTGFALAIDVGAPMVEQGGELGKPLFEGAEPSEMTRRALAFCDAFTRDNEITRKFVNMLQEQNLLVERSAQINLPSGRNTVLTGFKVVSPETFANLSEAVVVDWHRKGWLTLVHSHLTSLARMTDLLPKQ